MDPLRIILNIAQRFCPRILTRNDCQLCAKISQTHLGDIQFVYKNATFCGLDKAEKGQSEGTLSRTCSAENPDLKVDCE